MRDPHHAADKPARVRAMFSAIAGSYDLNNRLHSFGLDQRWREKAVALAGVGLTDTVVDVACGTGDLAIKFSRAGAGRVIGIDFTYPMLPLARAKEGRKRGTLLLIGGKKQECPPFLPTIQNPRSKIQNVTWLCADAMHLPLADACADVVSIAFGIRNVGDPLAALREFRRVLRPGGRLIILEFSLPTRPWLRGAYNFYFRHVLPLTATLVSRDRSGAYRYLPESVNTFLGRDELMALLRAAGFGQIEHHALSLGVCACYRGLARVRP